MARGATFDPAERPDQTSEESSALKRFPPGCDSGVGPSSCCGRPRPFPWDSADLPEGDESGHGGAGPYMTHRPITKA